MFKTNEVYTVQLYQMKTTIKLFIVMFFIQGTYAQEHETEKKEPPHFSLFRAEENYEYLKDKENSPYEEEFFDAIKFIPLNQKKMFISLLEANLDRVLNIIRIDCGNLRNIKISTPNVSPYILILV